MLPVPVKGYRLLCLMDEPPVLDCSVTPIPGNASLPLQVRASLPSFVQKINFINSTGRYIGVFKGPEGEEEFECVAEGEQNVLFSEGERISLRNLDADEIVTGSVFIQFMRLWG